MTRHMSGKWCCYYRAMSEHDTCEAGVAYESLKHLPFDKRPCFKKTKDEPTRPGCDLVEFPTPEQIAEYEAMIQKRFAATFTARAAIVEHLGGPWKKGRPGASGEIPCPVCTTGKLRFSRTGYNGHIHAHCSTKDCVQWME